jgi:hypothetical protein
MNHINIYKNTNLEKKLTSIRLTGTIEPFVSLLSEKNEMEYKFVTRDGCDYIIQASVSVKASLDQFVWQEVDAIGLLNSADGIFMLQKIIPKNSNHETENMIQLDVYKRKNVIKKIAKKVNDLVIIPLAVLAVLAS